MNIESFVPLLAEYKYLIVFPLAVLEGPIITIIAGFLSTLDVLNPLWVYILIILADLVGDTIYYVLGRYGDKALPRIVRFLGLTHEKIEAAKNYFNEHHRKAIILSKLIHGIGTAGLFVAGNIRVSYRRFILICLGTAMLQSAVFLAVGILFGHAYVQISKYLDVFGASTIILGLVVAVVLILRFRRK